MVYNYLKNIENAVLNQHYTQVVTAFQDIPANTTITSAMLQLKPYPTEARNNFEILDVKDAVGKISPLEIKKGEVLLSNRLVKPGESSDRLSYVVPEGFRAMSIPVTEVTGVANMIKKDDRVDVITVVPAEGDINYPYAAMVLQDIQVLAVDSNFTTADPATLEKASVPTTVTLAVDSQSALRLKVALQETNVSLTLRPATDRNQVDLVNVPLNQL
jgi:pilus assembly protein CpaB